MPEIAIVFSSIIILTIIVGITINAIVSKVLDHKRWERENSLIGSKSSNRNDEIADRTEMIEDRLRVLERLATDRGQLLSDEIEALRDERRSRREHEIEG